MLQPLILALCAAQNVQFHFDVDQNASLIDWEVNTSAGAVEDQPDKFRMNGSLNLKLDAAQAPFTLGQFNGALLLTIPNALYGEIPNPIPFLPPLATIDVVDLQARVTSGTFAINPATGDFTAIVTLHTTAGTTTLGGLFGSGTTPAFGLISLPTAVTGRVTQSGGTLLLHVDLNVSVAQNLGGITVDTSLVGPIDAVAQVGAANAFTVSPPVPLIAGLTQAISATNATPGGATFLAGTFSGLGSTPVPQLGVTLSLTAPVQVGSTVIAGANGSAAWSLTIPTAVIGRSVWFQALQSGRVSQVAGSYGI